MRLFLPELHLQAGPSLERVTQAVCRPPKAYADVRRKILVVDNEEADRDLLVSLLEPLGFVLRMAASGHDCLDLLAAGYDPDVVFMDLAMPGIDGWETLRRTRALGERQPQVAIVSANAFDRGADNVPGIEPDDFIVKPVRHSELLDWLERKLALTWMETADVVESPATPAPVANDTAITRPPRADLVCRRN